MPRKRKPSAADSRVAGDRRAARAVERGEEGALAGERAGGRRRDRSRASSVARARVVDRASRCRSRPARPPAETSSTSSIAVAASASPSRFRPASASSVASATPSSSLRSRVSTLPRNGTTSRSGRSRSISACRRSDEVPTVAPCGSSAMDLRLAADEGVARVLARQEGGEHQARPAAPSACPSTNAPRGRSRPASSASSISLVNRPLPPASASGRSWMRSPLVRIDLDRDPSGEAVRRGQRRAHHARLRQRQRAAARADAAGLHAGP